MRMALKRGQEHEAPGRRRVPPKEAWRTPRATGNQALLSQLRNNEVEPGRPLDPRLRRSLERRFSHSFEAVRVHTGACAAERARKLDARAFTVGPDIFFGAGEFRPRSREGLSLLAHELTHVVQASRGRIANSAGGEGTHGERTADRVAARISGGLPAGPIPHGPAPSIQRKRVGTAVTHGSATSPFTSVSATYDGSLFRVFFDGVPLLIVPAHSGRPNAVRAADASACGGATTDSYLNNPRYIGIRDRGAIPEGEYRFAVTEMATFTEAEQQEVLGLDAFPLTMGVLKTGVGRAPTNLMSDFAPAISELPGLMSSGIGHGSFTDPFGRAMHGGDWGRGRVALRPVRILPGPTGCGNTSTRSGFFLHGGLLAGSSGCIDIGDTAFLVLVALLRGFRGDITVTVRYTSSAPTVNAAARSLGDIIYPDTGR